MNFLNVIFAFGVILTIFGHTNSQVMQTRIEFLKERDSVPGTGAPYTGPQAAAISLVQNSKKICVQGIWALYTQPNFGLDNTTNIAVQTLSGCRRADCTSEPFVETTLKTIRSFLPLGQNPIQLFSQRNFILADPFEPIININSLFDPGSGMRTPGSAFIRSMVVTDNANNYLVCGKDTDNCFCVTPVNSPLIVRDFSLFPKAQPLEFIGKLQTYLPNAATPAECNNRFPDE